MLVEGDRQVTGDQMRGWSVILGKGCGQAISPGKGAQAIALPLNRTFIVRAFVGIDLFTDLFGEGFEFSLGERIDQLAALH